jgi:transcriptional regulator with GAF, ATPase, and Fis domain
MTMVPAARLAEVLVEVADTLVDEFDLIEFLHMVTAHTSELVQADSAGLLLADHHGRLQLMAASDERAEMLELYQLQANEGPCQDCFRQGKPVIDADLAAADADEIWPHFAPRAVAAGFRSVHAFPLRLRQTVIGALNLFGREVGRMAPADVRVVQALADIATIGLLQERTIHQSEVLTEQLQAALNSRVVIEQAKGVLAQIHSINTDEAFELLRSYARSHRQRLGEVAQAVIDDRASLPDLTTPRPA